MNDSANEDFGIMGMAVMGRNLALNIADNGFSVAVFNRHPELTSQAVTESGGRLTGAASLEMFVGTLKRPRKIILMIKAGAAVDSVLEQLKPLLSPDDIVADAGNSWFEDTRRREQECAAVGVRFFGVGVSGGEEGARFGPSIMPGGDKQAYEHLRPMFEAIAAKTSSGACVTYVGPEGAGHFVKMVHNGIEYADMQLIAEAYHMLSGIGGLQPDALAKIFDEWNQGPLASYLIEITAKIFTVQDDQGSGFLVDAVLDRAGQKGTGAWTAQVALTLGVPVPGIAAAIDARVLSSMKEERVRAAKVLGASTEIYQGDISGLILQVHDALFAAKVTAYAQGMALIAQASSEYDWSIDLGELARIWKGGCIIRARFLDSVIKAYTRNAQSDNLLLDVDIRANIQQCQGAWRKVVSLAQQHGVPVPGMSASLAYFDSFRTARLPQNLTQAQRDAFGAHTYQRVDDPTGPFVHSHWLT